MFQAIRMQFVDAKIVIRTEPERALQIIVSPEKDRCSAQKMLPVCALYLVGELHFPILTDYKG